MSDARQSPAKLIRDDLSNPSVLQQLKFALPEHVSVDKFVRVVMTAINSNSMLLQADRVSVLKACMEAAADGLLPDGREGAIVPFRNNRANRIEAQWQPMVWGLVKLVRNSGELKDIGVEIVRSSDKFERWIDEDGPHFKHTPSLSAEGDPIGVYAYARTKDGGFYIEYMPWSEVDKFRALSKAKDGPWNTWPEEMAKVRPIKRLCKRLPMSTDALAAIERDNQRDASSTVGERMTDPISALNQSITGAAPASESSPPALENAPSAVADFNAFDARIRNAASVEELEAIVSDVQGTAGFSDDDVVELKQMAAIRKDEFASA